MAVRNECLPRRAMPFPLPDGEPVQGKSRQQNHRCADGCSAHHVGEIVMIHPHHRGRDSSCDQKRAQREEAARPGLQGRRLREQDAHDDSECEHADSVPTGKTPCAGSHPAPDEGLEQELGEHGCGEHCCRHQHGGAPAPSHKTRHHKHDSQHGHRHRRAQQRDQVQDSPVPADALVQPRIDRPVQPIRRGVVMDRHPEQQRDRGAQNRSNGRRPPQFHGQQRRACLP
jgi:hypothetical protein